MTAPNTRSASGPEATITIFPPVSGMGCGGGSCSCGASAVPTASAADQLAEFSSQLRGLQAQAGSQGYYAPIIAINNRIVSTSAFPDTGQLVEHLRVAVP